MIFLQSFAFICTSSVLFRPNICSFISYQIIFIISMVFSNICSFYDLYTLLTIQADTFDSFGEFVPVLGHFLIIRLIQRGEWYFQSLCQQLYGIHPRTDLVICDPIDRRFWHPGHDFYLPGCQIIFIHVITKQNLHIISLSGSVLQIYLE